MDLLVKIILLLTASRNVKSMPGFIIELENGEHVYIANDNNLDSSAANFGSVQHSHKRAIRGEGNSSEVHEESTSLESNSSETSTTIRGEGSSLEEYEESTSLESNSSETSTTIRGEGSSSEVHEESTGLKSNNSETNNTQMTVSIRGKIILPAVEAFTFPENSNLLVRFQDTNMMDGASVTYGNTTIDLSNKASKEEIRYSIEAEVPNNKLRHTFSVSAVINKGWKGSLMDPNSEEWLKNGDFFNDMAHDIQMKEGVAKYEKDITVIEISDS